MDSQLVCSMVEVEDFTTTKPPPPRFSRKKRVLGLVAALVVVGAVVGVVASTSSDASSPAKASMASANLGMAIGYDTYQAHKIDEHFAKIAQRFAGVRSFQTWIPNGNVIDAAAKANLHVYPGIWIRGGDVNKDIQAAIDGTKRHPGSVRAVFVGNEDLSNGWNAGQIIGKIKDVRWRFQQAGLGYVKIGSVQIDGDWLAHPEIAEHCDVVGVNIYPFFGGSPVSWQNPIGDMDARWKPIWTKFGNKAVITETGWPFAGGNFGNHVSSWTNAIKYFNDFKNWAQWHGGDQPAYFMYHNNPGKGGFEANFGLADENGNWKFDFPAQKPSGPGPAPAPTSPAPAPSPVFNRYRLPFLLQTKTNKMIYEMWDGLFAYDEATCANERWRYNLGTNQIVSESNGKCLDAYAANGKFYVHTWTCDAKNVNQKWNIDTSTDQIKHLTHANLCLDVDPTRTDASVQVWACTGGPNQQIRVNPDLPHVGLSSLKTGHVLASKGDRVFFRKLDGSFKNVQADKAAMWTFVQSKNMVVHEASGKCLDAYEAKNGGTVHLWDCSDANANQKWTYDPNMKQLRHGTHSDFCLDMATEAGENPYLWQCHGAGDFWLPFQEITFVM